MNKNLKIIELVDNSEDSETIYCMEENGYMYATISFEKSSESMYIYNVCVKEENRNNKLGTWLIRYLENIGIRYNKKFSALTALKDKEWLINWYKKLGYSIYSNDDKYFYMIKYLK